MSKTSSSDFSISELFSQAFKPHHEEELESHWCAGAIGTIPPLGEIKDDCPKPWAFVRILGIALATYLLLLLGWSKFHNSNFIPGVLIIGCAVIPFSVLVFFFEMNIRRNVSMYMVTKLAVWGGALSLVYTLCLGFAAEYFQLNLQRFGASSAGFVEEIAKLLAVMLVVNRKRYPYILNGMLFGAAIGTGFAIYESAGYAFNALIVPVISQIIAEPKAISDALQATNGNLSMAVEILFNMVAPLLDKGMLASITLRGLLAPFSHIIWTALAAGALWQVKENRSFTFGMFCDIRFIVMMLCSIALHFAWNSSWDFRLVTAADKYILLGVLGWMLVLWMFRTGLRQIADQKAAAGCENGMSDVLVAQHQRVERMLAAPEQAPRDYDRPAVNPAPASQVKQEVWKDEDPAGLMGKMEDIKKQEESRDTVNHASKGWQRHYSN